MDKDITQSLEAEWIAFGPFVLHFRQRVLMRDGKRVVLNARALELLIALLERPGRVLSKDVLIERIWRDRTVAEVNLRVTVTALRKCLTVSGMTYILNSAGRGYAFSSDIPLEYWPPRTLGSRRTEAESEGAVQGRLPLLLKPVIGREGTAAKILRLLDLSRLVNIVGAAGIGKTTVAVLAASEVTERVCFVDFAPAGDVDLVLARISASLTLDQPSGDPLKTIVNAIGDKKMLIVLDNCEHLLGSVADAATAILQNAPQVRILATSREPLYMDGEMVFRLEGLSYPEETFAGDAQKALTYAAVRLLVERVQAASPDFSLTENLVGPAAEICRRLDGIALAIQLAAGRAATFGLVQVAFRLTDRFRFLSRGSRTALPRHQTLDAAIGWSFELLDPNERLVCARLSVFSGEFSLEAAVDVAGWAPIAPHEAATIVASLVEKSLIVFVADPTRPHYVFLETIREFARGRLRLVDTNNELLRKLVQRLVADCDHFSDLVRSVDVANATEFARRRMDDMRFAIGKAFEVGETALQSALLVSFAPLMLHLGTIFELTDWSRRALDGATSSRERLSLLMPYARALGLSRPNLSEQISLYKEAVDIAQVVEDRESELRARWGLSYLSGQAHSPKIPLDAGYAFEDRARELGDLSAVFVAKALQGCALHDLGEFSASMKVHRSVVDEYAHEASAADANRFGLNHRAVSMCDLSEGCWQLGQVDEAEAWNLAAIAEAGDHLPTLFKPLSQRLCRAIYVGTDWAEIGRQFDTLTRRFNVDGRWKGWIRNLDAIIEIHRYKTEAALVKLDSNILAGRWEGLTNRYIWIAVHVVQCCLILRKMELARKLSDQLVATLEATQCRWFLPEALRLKAVSLVDHNKQAAAACFNEAKICAAELGASSFGKYIEASYDAHRDAMAYSTV
jgi:predicted ATPase/DNA-binding winged helix-turn-helix (wHTH) protein